RRLRPMTGHNESVTHVSGTDHGPAGWGARIRTWEWRNQNPLPYHLATPHRHARKAGGRSITAQTGPINVRGSRQRRAHARIITDPASPPFLWPTWPPSSDRHAHRPWVGCLDRAHRRVRSML